ncbi:MAG: hypothetical protein L6R36_008982 [Xanthoria steineri]|nr:MAG: hypothetical protein L6R36_008982 [Xanthoria steineri]
MVWDGVGYRVDDEVLVLDREVEVLDELLDDEEEVVTAPDEDVELREDAELDDEDDELGEDVELDDEDVELGEDAELDDEDEDEDDEVVVNRLPAPQYCEVLPGHTLLHWVSTTLVEVEASVSPHQHSRPYSIPAY